MKQRLAKATIEKVKQYDGIVAFIQQYISLKKRGQNYIGLCPFHGERTPSFTVSPTKRIFHCFGCHESGDLIAFAEKIDSLTFLESIEVIARFAGIPIEYDILSEHDTRLQKERDKQREALRHALDFFVVAAKGSAKITKYVTSRGISAESSTTFLLGYCSRSSELQAYLTQQGCLPKTLESLGLLTGNGQHAYCRFQGRLIFPIYDFHHKIIGFSGRVLDDTKQVAKYINSEESALFNKRACCYGLSLAKQAIKSAGCVIVVEGYLDVVMCHQFGIQHVVACMGTALTVQQLQLLKRVTDKIILMLDGDKAGITAMTKSVMTILDKQLHADVVQLDNGDPADVLCKQGKAALLAYIDDAVPCYEFLFYQLKKTYDLTKIDQVSAFVQALIPILSTFQDGIIRHHYIAFTAQRLEIEKDLIIAKITEFLYNKPVLNQTYTVQKGKDKAQKAEETLTVLLLLYSDLRHLMTDTVWCLFFNKDYQRMGKEVVQTSQSSGDLLSQFNPHDKKIISALMVTIPEFKSDKVVRGVFDDCIAVLEKRYQQHQCDLIKKKIIGCEQKGEDKQVELLLMQLNEIKKGGFNGAETTEGAVF